MGKKRNKPRPGNTGAAPITSGPAVKKKVSNRGLKGMSGWLVLLVALLPFLFSRETIDPTLTPRYLLLAGFILLFILFFYTRKKILFPFPLLIKMVFGFGIAFVVWSLLCMSNAINFAEGYYEISRQLLFLVVLFVIMTTVAQEPEATLRICKTVTIVAILQSLVGIFQYYDIAFTDLPGNFIPYGLMANRNLFGSAEALVIPFVLYVVYKGSRNWKYAGGLALIFITIALVLSQTRSAWLAGIAILIVSLVFVLIFSPVNRKKWMIGSLIAIVAIAGIVSLLLLSDKEGTLSFSVKERAASLTGMRTDTSAITGNVSERLKIWEKTMQLIKDKPVFGAGPGNWKIAIPAYGTEGLVWAKGFYVPDRPHNVYLLVAAETGIPGAVFYFGMWAVIAIIAFRAIAKPGSEDMRILVILMLAGLTAFAVDCLFGWPAERVEHSLYMLLMSGIILGSYSRLPEINTHTLRPVGRSLVVAALVILAFNLFLGFRKYNFEIHSNRAKAYEKLGKPRDVLREADAGKSTFVTLDPIGNPAENMSAMAYMDLKDYTNALKEINTAKRYNPNSARIFNNMGTIYTEMKDFPNAVKAYQQALHFAPDYDIIYRNLAVNYFQLGNDSACIAALSKANIGTDPYLTGLLNESKKRLASKK